ncbi:MAG TPA: TonB family protein [Pyrinomonadaceae bacterium]|nr:TonB family protein [Pyrinomonadaceae bacterium]
MKTRLPLLLLLATVAGCSLLFGPTATVKKFMSAAQKGDAATMTQLFSQKGIEKLGLDRIKQNNEQFAQLCKKQAEANGAYIVDTANEKTSGDTSRVSIIYHDKSRNDSIRLVFDLSKEGGSWKIDDIGGSEKEETSGSEPTSSSSPFEIPSPPPATEETTNPPGTISGGVLNAKATSLPQPTYPPIARSAKASGTVTVQVTVDEKGNVVSATAVSGHPLLRAAAVAAARRAQFSPTKLSGQPVKVNGIITYNFVAE